MNHNESRCSDITLSQAGQQRRDQMLSQLQRQMQRRNRRRQIQSGVVIAVVLLVATIVMGPRWKQQGPLTKPVAESSQGPSARPQLAAATMPDSAKSSGVATVSSPAEPNVVRNRPSVLDRFVVSDVRPAESLEIEIISDDELLDWLSEAGQPAFLGRIDGEVVLIPRKSL